MKQHVPAKIAHVKRKNPPPKLQKTYHKHYSSVFRNEWALTIILLTITFICYFPSLGNDFVYTWDDNAYITDNLLIRSLSLSSIGAMFTSQVGGTYVPLPLLSYAIEYKLWGLNPMYFHATNLMLHLICTLLVYRILRRLQLDPVYAAAGALIYGIHPMGVESVAWITERKDLLYCVFYFASLLAYIKYVQGTKRNFFLFALSLSLFVLALFSKIQAVSLPMVLLAVDYYFARKASIKLFAEKIPFFLLSLVFGLAGILVLKNVGALKINEMYTFTERFFFGIYSLCVYLIKFLVPVTMSALYPYPVTSGHALPSMYYLSPLMVLLIGWLVYRTAGATRSVVFGALVFFLSIFLMLQIFGAGAGFMADRYVKIPYLGLVFITVWGMSHFNNRYKNGSLIVWITFSVFASFLMVTTFQRCKIWKDGGTLWSDVIEKYPGRDARPYSCRGLYYREKKENDKAFADFNRSLVLRSDDPEILLFRGNIFFDRGRDDSAYADYIKVLKFKMDNALALGNLGSIYVRRGQPDSAVICLNRSVALDSTSAINYANRAVALGALGRTDESIADFKHYLTQNPKDERVLMSIAMAYQNLGQFQESISWFDKAIAVKPDFGNYYYFRSRSYQALGNRGRALADGLRASELGAPVPQEYLKSLR
jgi:tetratricopeptide (TPR) repeat protein